MFVRKKNNKSGKVSVQVIDKSSGKYKVIETIGSSSDAEVIEKLLKKARQFIQQYTGLQEIDFNDYNSSYTQVLSSIIAHKLVGIELVLGKIFDEVGFNQIGDTLFRDLVLYRLIYPRSKLKTTEYLYRYEQKEYSEDDIYRYMDKLHSTQKELVQSISYQHTLKVLKGDISVVFYDVTTIYFEADIEDEFRKTGFSKEGKHQNPQIVLGLLVSSGGYPMAYEIFEGNKFEGHTMLPVLESFRAKYNLKQLIVVADSGLLSSDNIKDLIENEYEFILGARIKNEKQYIKNQILQLQLKNSESQVIEKGDFRLIITYSDFRAKKDRYNREKGLRKLEKQLKTGKLTKSNINNRGYNKFLEMEGEISIKINQEKILEDHKWDGLKGYLTNSTISNNEILENYQQLWLIEKAFRIAKTDLKIRPIYHYKKRRIEAHICLNFVAYKIYKELERMLKAKNSSLSPEKVIEILQNIYELTLVTPNNTIVKQKIILTDEQRQIQQLFNF